MPRLALGIEYDGSDFHGWQIQPNGILTVQERLQKALSRIADHPVQAVCAGRTDRGVHATGQVVHIDTTAERTPYQWQMGANSQLPPTIRVQWVQPMPEDFHARHSAIARRYHYIVDTRPFPSALAHRMMSWHRYPVCIEAMHSAAQCLLGEHDFSAFRGPDCQAKTPIRRLQAISVQPYTHGFYLDITGNAFLHHMVRNIMGALYAIGRGEISLEDLVRIRDSRDRKQAPPMMPPVGLYLSQVYYPPPYDILPPAGPPFFLEI